MTENLPAPYEPRPAAPRSAAPAALIDWAQAAQAAHTLARPLCQTDFVPQHFRGNESAATAAILYGAEAGLSPLQALQGIYVISGRPAMYARTMLAITLAAGHEVWTEEATDSRVIVCGRRRGSNAVERVVWTLDRAKRAGYTRNAKYSSDPQAMLRARADAEVCRRIAPDALLGMAYAVEELEDSAEAAPVVATQPGKRTARRAALPRPPEPDLDPEPEPEQATPAEPAEQAEPGAAEQPKAEPGISDPQLRKLHTLMTRAGLVGREDGLAFLSVEVSRPITSSRELTRDEASRIIDHLEQADSEEPSL